jgi:hypothetical protein
MLGHTIVVRERDVRLAMKQVKGKQDATEGHKAWPDKS